MYKLAVLDIDGTLLNPKGKLTKHTIRIIKTLQKSGIHVTLCTGRNLRVTKQFIRRLGIQIPFICVDGTVGYHDIKGKLLYDNNLDEDELQWILNIVEQEDVYIEVLADHRYYKYIKSPHAKKYDVFRKKGFWDVFLRRWRGARYVKTRQFFATRRFDHIHQVIVGGEQERLQRIKKKIQQQNQENIEIRDQVWDNFMFIHKKNVGKAVGIQKLCEYLQITMDEVIALGDEKNDLDMIEQVGLGIAMGNALDEVKMIANDVTLSNADNGAAHALEHYFIKNKTECITTSRKE